MTENQYDDAAFFQEYAKMTRSRQGLAGAGEWRQFRRMFPPLEGKSVLDLGCGYGWHCRYAVEQGGFRGAGDRPEPTDAPGSGDAKRRSQNHLPGGSCGGDHFCFSNGDHKAL